MKQFYSKGLTFCLLSLLSLLTLSSCNGKDDQLTLRASVSEVTTKLGDTPDRIIVYYGDNAIAPTWNVSPSDIAIVTSGLINPLKVGKATLTASYEGQSVSIALTVNPADPSTSQGTLTITPASLSVEAGKTDQLRATLAGKFVTATWSSASNEVATVDATGLVTGVSAGEVQITASYLGQTATATITVTAAKVNYILPILSTYSELSEYKKWEEARGHQAQIDEKNGFVVAATGNPHFPQIVYIPFQRIMMPAQANLLESPAFYEYMKTQGFETTGKRRTNAPIIDFTTSKYTTLQVFAVVGDYSENGNQLPTGLYIDAVDITFSRFLAPSIKWNESHADLNKRLLEGGFTASGSSTDKVTGNEVHFYIGKISKEYPGYLISSYLYNRDKKLIQSELIVMPYTLLIDLKSSKLLLRDYYREFLRQQGYTEAPRTDKPEEMVYTNTAQNAKCILKLYKLTVEEAERFGACLTFTPADVTAYEY